jgi:hypothetical protein
MTIGVDEDVTQWMAQLNPMVSPNFKPRLQEMYQQPEPGTESKGTANRNTENFTGDGFDGHAEIGATVTVVTLKNGAPISSPVSLAFVVILFDYDGVWLVEDVEVIM